MAAAVSHRFSHLRTNFIENTRIQKIFLQQLVFGALVRVGFSRFVGVYLINMVKYYIACCFGTR